MNPKVKICGIKQSIDLERVAQLKPDYLGFIFYDKSPRFMIESLTTDNIIEVDKSIKKIGVFVNETNENIINNIEKYELSGVQLHGDESVEQVRELYTYFDTIHLLMGELTEEGERFEIIKAFGMDESFNFSILKPYEPYVDFFLLDTKSKNYGGTGRKFDWSILKKYDSSKPIFLSGGIGIKDIEAVRNLSLNVYALDLNSKLESAPGIKKIELVEEAIKKIRKENVES